MTASVLAQHGGGGDPHHLRDHDQESTGGGEGGPASKRIVVAYGFWIFLISDIIMFSAFFAAYAVLAGATAGGPSGKDLFKLGNVAIQTALLLLSSFTCGLASIAVEEKKVGWTQLGLFVTGLLELREFAGMIAEGAGPGRSAFLSSFFTLVGCHGLHVGIGLLWCGTMMAQFHTKGFREDIVRRMMCFALFWHALDIIWVGVMTIVYLIGARG